MLSKSSFLFRGMFLGAMASWVGGCLDPGIDLGNRARVPDAGYEDLASPLDVSNTPCAQDGLGTLRVAVSLAPALAHQTADVWLAVHCNDNPAPVRLVRWDGSASQTLDHFGPGTYRVLGTSLRAPGHWSTVATLSGVSTAAVSLTLGGDGIPIATLTSATGDRDGGVGPDASAGTPLEWRARAPLRDPSGQTLGAFQVTARAVGDEVLEVSTTVQNLCAVPPCAALPLVGIEARSLDGETPYGAVIGSFERPEAPYGEVVRTLPVRLRGRLPDARHVLQFAVYAAIPPVPRGGTRPSRP